MLAVFGIPAANISGVRVHFISQRHEEFTSGFVHTGSQQMSRLNFRIRNEEHNGKVKI
jgi:hypothetical protein